MASMTEQEKAELSKQRGQAAAKITDPEQRKKFIAAQGDVESKNKGQMPPDVATRMKKESDEATATDSQSVNIEGVKSYAKGTMHVPKTGMAKLHKGEAVLDKATADKYRSALAGLAGEEKPAAKPEKKLKEMRIRKAASGGHIIEHHHMSPMDHPMEEHTASSMKDLMAHMQQHMGDNEGAESSPDSESAEGEMPSYKDGTDNVPKTGPAMLHKGEAVLPADKAAAYRVSKDTPDALQMMGKVAERVSDTMDEVKKNAAANRGSMSNPSTAVRSGMRK